MDPITAFDIDRLVDALRERGRRSTTLKRAVLHAFEAGDCALTAEEIGFRIGFGADLSALYRCLASLEDAGIVTHGYLGDGARRYDLADEFGGHHHHLVCETCSRITRLDGCVLPRDITAEAAALGHTVRAHEIVLKGVCAGCREAREELHEA